MRLLPCDPRFRRSDRPLLSPPFKGGPSPEGVERGGPPTCVGPPKVALSLVVGPKQEPLRRCGGGLKGNQANSHHLHTSACPLVVPRRVSAPHSEAARPQSRPSRHTGTLSPQLNGDRRDRKGSLVSLGEIHCGSQVRPSQIKKVAISLFR